MFHSNKFPKPGDWITQRHHGNDLQDKYRVANSHKRFKISYKQNWPHVYVGITAMLAFHKRRIRPPLVFSLVNSRIF